MIWGMDRPDLSGVDQDVVAYIEMLEKTLLEATAKSARKVATAEPSEPETTIQIITMTKSGIAKRTARHHYLRQNRGGMGVFDIETTENDPPFALVEADESADILIITDQGRTFRIPVLRVADTAVRGKGESLGAAVQLLDDERIIALLPADAGKYVIIASERGWVRRIRDIQLNAGMIQGIRHHKISNGGRIVSACWSDGDGDALVTTRAGKGLRFNEEHIPSSGVRGIRLDVDDVVNGIVATNEGGGVFVISEDGKGTIRLMDGFRKNKAPGAGGKVLHKTANLCGVAAVPTPDTNDIFIISKTSKIIRFSAADVPPKTGVVQGVNCMNLRADEVAAVLVNNNH